MRRAQTESVSQSRNLENKWARVEFLSQSSGSDLMGKYY